ncbi:MAG: methyltransferase domain-containing protein [bacterium]|nr:methyltransferase domain-containing protein [bacterium]
MTTDPYIAYTHRFFGRWVGVYDLFARSIAPAYRAAVRVIEPRAGRSILDICTGTGEIALRCARQGAEVTGIDVTPAMLAKARKKAGDLPVRFEVMDARDLAFPDSSFDLATVSFGLHDMPRRVRLEVLREAARVTRERLVILDYELPKQRLPGALLLWLVGMFESAYFKGFVREGAPALLREAGLRTVEVKRVAPLFSVHGVAL